MSPEGGARGGTSREGPDDVRLGGRRRRRRTAAALALLLVVLAAGAVLPRVLRGVLAEQASAALRTRVTVGDVDVFPLWGAVVLSRVAVWPPEEPGASAGPASTRPLLAWRRLAVDLDWWALLGRTVRLTRLELDGPLVNLDRLQTGELNLARLLERARPAADAEPAAPAPEPAWTYGIDHLEITRGRVAFRDFVVGQTEPILVRIPDIRADRLALSPALYGEASAAHARLQYENGSVDVVARASLPAAGPAARVRLAARSLPLDRSRLYVPGMGWSELHGTLDARVRYEFATGSRHRVVAAATLRDVEIRVPDDPDTALAARRLFLRVDPVDVLGRRLTVRAAAVEGASLSLRTDGDTPFLPVLGRTPEAAPAAERQDAEAEPPSDAPPWAWRLDALDVRDFVIRVLGPSGTVDIGVAASARGVSSSDRAPGSFSVAVAAGGGTVALAGHVRIADPAAGGTLAIGNLSLPVLLETSNALRPNPLLGGTLDAALSVEAGLTPEGTEAPSPADLRVRGQVTLREARLEVPGEDGSGTRVGAAQLRADLADLALLGVLPGAQGQAAGTHAGSLRLEGELALQQAVADVGGPAPVQASVDAATVAVSRLGLNGVLAKRDAPGSSRAAGPPGGADDGRDVDLAARVRVSGPRLAVSGARPLTTAAKEIAVEVGRLWLDGLPGAAGEPRAGGDRAGLAGGITISGGTVQLDGGTARQLRVGVPAMALRNLSVEASGVVRPADSGAAAAAPAIRASGQLALVDPDIELGDAEVLRSRARRIDLKVKELALAGLGAMPAGARDGAASANGDLRFSADLSVAQPEIGLAGSKDLRIAATGLAVGLTRAVLPGVLAPEARGQGRPMQVALGEVRLEAPRVRLTRGPHGLVLGPASPQSAVAAAPAGDAEAAGPPAEEPPPERPAVPVPDVSLGHLAVTRGRLDFVDRSVAPAFDGRVSRISVDVRDFRLPGPEAARLHLGMDTPGEGTIRVTGRLGSRSSEVRVESADVALRPYSPYARAFSPYRIDDGTLSAVSRIVREGTRYDTNTHLTFDDLEVSGREGESLFAQQFGVPLSTALALLTDIDGKIRLDVPATLDAGGLSVGVGQIAADVVRKALVNALASPLKLVGALAGGGSEARFTAPAPIAFRTGRADLADAGLEAVQRLGRLLGERPALGVLLQSEPTREDARWLHEQALRQRWAEGGVVTRALTRVGARRRVQAYLEARAQDAPANLDAADAAQLDAWLQEIPRPSGEAMKRLAAERLARVAAQLADGYGIGPARVRIEEPEAAETDGAPVVELALKRAARLHRSPGNEAEAPE